MRLSAERSPRSTQSTPSRTRSTHRSPLAGAQPDARVTLEETEQPGQHAIRRQGALHVNPQQAAGTGAGEGGLGFLDLGQDRRAAPVIGPACYSVMDTANTRPGKLSRAG